jgi:hypothetical protein
MEHGEQIQLARRVPSVLCRRIHGWDDRIRGLGWQDLWLGMAEPMVGMALCMVWDNRIHVYGLG